VRRLVEPGSSGTRPVVLCPNHAWAFKLDGSLHKARKAAGGSHTGSLSASLSAPMPCCIIGWLTEGLTGSLIGSLAGSLVGSLAGSLVGWLTGWLAHWLAGSLVDSGQPEFDPADFSLKEVARCSPCPSMHLDKLLAPSISSLAGAVRYMCSTPCYAIHTQLGWCYRTHISLVGALQHMCSLSALYNTHAAQLVHEQPSVGGV
jgi:hypothetical protein